MLMKWTDLLPGDVIRFTDQAAYQFGDEGWANVDDDILLINVTEVEEQSNPDEKIRFWFIDKYGIKTYIYTDIDGKYIGVTLFEIVKLAGD